MMEPTGQPEAAQRLGDEIAEFRPRLYAFAYSLTRDAEEASDLAQETCAHALHAAHRFEPGTNLKAWLFTILRNLHLNQKRAQANHPVVVEYDELVAERWHEQISLNSVEHAVVRRAEVAEVARALDSVPDVFATPLRLASVGQLSYEEIAAVLGIPLGTVMSRIHRARRMLIRTLAEGAP